MDYLCIFPLDRYEVQREETCKKIKKKQGSNRDIKTRNIISNGD
jgi:hypothetical protein